MTSDPICRHADSRAKRDAGRHRRWTSPASKLKTEIARILKEEVISPISRWPKRARRPSNLLKYSTVTRPVISAIERVSRPVAGYVGQSDIPRVLGGMASIL